MESVSELGPRFLSVRLFEMTAFVMPALFLMMKPQVGNHDVPTACSSTLLLWFLTCAKVESALHPVLVYFVQVDRSTHQRPLSTNIVKSANRPST